MGCLQPYISIVTQWKSLSSLITQPLLHTKDFKTNIFVVNLCLMFKGLETHSPLCISRWMPSTQNPVCPKATLDSPSTPLIKVILITLISKLYPLRPFWIFPFALSSTCYHFLRLIDFTSISFSPIFVPAKVIVYSSLSLGLRFLPIWSPATR